MISKVADTEFVSGVLYVDDILYSINGKTELLEDYCTKPDVLALPEWQLVIYRSTSSPTQNSIDSLDFSMLSLGMCRL